MKPVRAKKHLGQHFLKEQAIAERIAQAVELQDESISVLEIGPGTGILSRKLDAIYSERLRMIELDSESVEYLLDRHPDWQGRIAEGDFLKCDLPQLIGESSFGLVGNFPYNISSQILFKALDHRDQIPVLVGMFQKEVAERVVSEPGTKVYGILSVLLQSYYRCEYLFTVSEQCFAPPPKVKSAVIRLRRRPEQDPALPYPYLKKVVKMAFGQRRKTLRNSLKPLLQQSGARLGEEILGLRPEALSPERFAQMAKEIRDAELSRQ